MIFETREPRRGIIDFVASHKNTVVSVPLGLLAVFVVAARAADTMRSGFDRDGANTVQHSYIVARTAIAMSAETGGLPALAGAGGPTRIQTMAAKDKSVRLWHAASGSRRVIGAAFGPPVLDVSHAKRGRQRKTLTAASVRPLRFQIKTWRAAPTPVSTLPTLDLGGANAALAVPAVTPPQPLDAIGPENRRAAPLGIAADTMRFDDRPGRLSTAAETGTLNGQPAAAMGLGYTLPDGRARLNATGVRSVIAGQKTFGVSAVASLALD